MRAMVSKNWRLTWIVLVLGIMASVLPSLHVWAQSDGVTLLRLQEAQVQPGETVDLDLILVNAPEGVQRFHIRVFVEDPSIAQMQGVTGGVISGPFFQVVSQTEQLVEFRSVDLEDAIDSKTTDLVLATVTLVGMKEGETALNAEIELLVSDEGNWLEPSIVPGAISVIAASTPAPPTTATVPTPSPQVELPSPPPAIVYERQPKDLDGDGVYEDFDGDGRFTAKDIALFAYYVNGEMIQGNQRLYDVDGDGGADIDDALALASFVELSTTAWPILRLEEKTATVEKDVDLDLVLANAPGGLQWYDITIFLEDGNIAQVKWVDSQAIDGRFFEIVDQATDSIRFRAADLKNEVLPGAGNLLLAKISLSVLQPGETAVWMVVNPMVDDQGKKVEPLVTSGSLKIVVFTIGRSSSPPMDPDGDGLFEDINGDGKVTFEDGRIFSFNVTSQEVQENWRLFDFDGDGDADFEDAMVLVQMVEEGASAP